MNQQTIAEKIACTGVGLHSGEPVQMTLHPARENTGVVFVRTDLPHPVEIPARADAVTATRLATTIGCGDVTVGTVEHLLAALYALGVTNVRVELDAAELPVMDGSAAPFVHLIRSAGVFRQTAARRTLCPSAPLEVRDGARFIRIEPSSARGLAISYAVDFDHPAIGRQAFACAALDGAAFERELARARTFGFLREVEALRRAGLARGGELGNTVVLDDARVLNPEGLRWRDEFVRHKVLDLLGDLALLGVALEGRITVRRGGHALHHQLVRAIALHAPEFESADAPLTPHLVTAPPSPSPSPASPQQWVAQA